jgi:peptidoglycan hydrolase CwlO-like protein
MDLIVNFLITTITTLIAYVIGRRRASKETDNLILQNIEKSVSIYQIIIDDMGKQIVSLNKKIDDLETKVDELLKENNELRTLIKKTDANTRTKVK